MLTISGLTKTYAKSGIPAVDNLSLTVKDGEIYGFIGPNGAGKSTTIKCVTGVLDYTQGSIAVNGADMRSEPLKAKRFVGYVSDDHAMYERLTGAEFVTFMCDVYDVPVSERRKRLARYVDLFDLQGDIGKPISSYSHGMKQKLSIIGALIHEPQLWVLDEPMTGLDPKSSYNLKMLMKEHTAKGNSVFFSSHVLDVVEKICDRVGIIDHGKLIADCTTAELRSSGLDSSLEELFLSITADKDARGFAFDEEGSGDGRAAQSAATDGARKSGADTPADGGDKA